MNKVEEKLKMISDISFGLPHVSKHIFMQICTHIHLHTHKLPRTHIWRKKTDQGCVSYFVITSQHLTKQLVLRVWGKIQSIMARNTRQLDHQVAGHMASMLRRQGTDRKLEQEVKLQEHPSTNTTMSPSSREALQPSQRASPTGDHAFKHRSLGDTFHIQHNNEGRRIDCIL